MLSVGQSNLIGWWRRTYTNCQKRSLAQSFPVGAAGRRSLGPYAYSCRYSCTFHIAGGSLITLNTLSSLPESQTRNIETLIWAFGLCSHSAHSRYYRAWSDLRRSVGRQSRIGVHADSINRSLFWLPPNNALRQGSAAPNRLEGGAATSPLVN
jgi:hypothetical protein